MMPLMRNTLSRDLSPILFACLPIETENDKLIFRVGMGDAKDTFRLIFRFRECGIDFACIDCREDEDLVLPDNRTGDSFSIDRDLPADVLVLAPLTWWRGGRRNSGDIRSAPLMPVTGSIFRPLSRADL